MRSCGATMRQRRIAKYQVSGKSNPAGMEFYKLEMIELPSYIAFIRSKDASQLASFGIICETHRNETMICSRMMRVRFEK